MADIKQISVDGVVYDIKDETARTQIEELAANSSPDYTYGTEDLTAGTSALETGKLYFVYE